MLVMYKEFKSDRRCKLSCSLGLSGERLYG